MNSIHVSSDQGNAVAAAAAFVHSQLVAAVADLTTSDSDGEGDNDNGNDAVFCICLFDSRDRRFIVLNRQIVPNPQALIRSAHDVVLTANTSDEAVEKAERILYRLTRISGNLTSIVMNSARGQEPFFQWTVHNQVEFPMTEEAGYQELLAHFFGALPTIDYGIAPLTQPWNGPKVDHDRILAILDRFPNLASREMNFSDYEIEEEEYEIYGPETCYHHPPLCCILGSPNAARLDIVKEVYEMMPEEMLKNRLYGQKLLHFSLLINPSNEVVEFIFQTDPDAIFDDSFDDDCTPMERVLRGLENGTMQLSTLRLLLDLCPEVVGFQTFIQNQDLLEIALERDCPLEVVSLIAKRYPSKQDKIHIPGDKISRPKAQVLRSLLPRFERILLHQEWSKNGALPMLLSSIARGPNSLTELSLSLIPLNRTTGQLVKLVLSRTSTLQVFEVSFKGDVRGEHSVEVGKAFHKILAGLYANTSLRSVELEHFPLIPWKKTQCSDGGVEQGVHAITTRALRRVSLKTHCIHESFVPGMLAAFPSVRDLLLTLDLEKDNPHDLENLIRMQPFCVNLNKFHVWIHDKHIDDARLRKLCDVLKRNAPITQLHVEFEDTSPYEHKVQDGLLSALQESNVTLKNTGLFRRTQPPTRNKYVEPIPKLQYFLDLNECGRKVARSHHTHKELFVKLLAGVADAFLSYRDDLSNKERKHIMQYGLLLEAPGLWSI